MDNLKLDSIILLYSNEDRAYAEIANIIKGKNGNVMGEAKPFTLKQLETLKEFRDRSKKGISANFIPENLLSTEPLIWYIPAGPHNLCYIPELNIPDGEVNLPALVFKYYQYQLSIYGMKDEGRPTPDTELYIIPFLNTYINGSICMGTGTVRSQSKVYSKMMEKVQRAFFETPFSHESMNFEGHNLYTFWKDLAVNYKYGMDTYHVSKPYPHDMMRPYTNLSKIIGE
jgi:PRTRC genetic system protein B